MERELYTSTGTPEWQTIPAPDFKPSPEHLQELPPQVFNVEQMKSVNIAALIISLEAGATVSRSDESAIGTLTGLLQRDLTCLPARNLEKAREVIFFMAAHEHNFVRAVAGDVIDSLFRFQPPGDYAARQQVIDVWVNLAKDDDEMVCEGAVQGIEQAIQSGWIEEPVAQYLASKLQSE
ncbi:hypothetical protein [Streptomyces sp. NPDC054829]